MDINIESTSKPLSNEQQEKLNKLIKAVKKAWETVKKAVLKVWDSLKMKIAIAFSNHETKLEIIRLQKIKDRTKNKRIKKKLSKRIFKMVFNN